MLPLNKQNLNLMISLLCTPAVKTTNQYPNTKFGWNISQDITNIANDKLNVFGSLY